MAYIKTLKDNELIGGSDNTDVYPVSTTQAIFSQKPDGTIPSGIKHQRLEERLEDHEEDAQELHRKAEKLVVYLSNDKAGQTLEITGTDNNITLTGTAQIETYGDEPASSVSFSDMDVKKLTISSGSAILEEINNWSGTTTHTMLDIAGTYQARFDCTYNGIAKYITTIISVNLRKYFGFSSNSPSDITSLATSHFSNGVGCTVTIPSNGTGFQKLYMAVPINMTISRVTQPDALNAPLAFSQVGTVVRLINRAIYSYKIYASTDYIDASVPKRLTIE